MLMVVSVTDQNNTEKCFEKNLLETITPSRHFEVTKLMTLTLSSITKSSGS